MVIICLKDPPIFHVCEGYIPDNSAAQYDEIFRPMGGCIFEKRISTQKNIVYPISRDSNIAYIEEITKEELEERQKKMKEMQEKNLIDIPGAGISGGPGRGRFGH